MGHQICFPSLKTQLTSKLTFFLLQSRSLYSQVEILCRLILRVKKKVWRCSSFSSVSSLARFVVVECRKKNVRSFRCLGKTFFFLHGCLIRILRFLLSGNWGRSYSNVDTFSLPKLRRKSVILVLWKVADVFKLNDESEVTSWSMKSNFCTSENFSKCRLVGNSSKCREKKLMKTSKCRPKEVFKFFFRCLEIFLRSYFCSNFFRWLWRDHDDEMWLQI